jgi:hypothetical protein
MALQISAFTGSSGVKLRAAPTSLIARCGDDAASRLMADCDWLILKIRIVALLDRHVESVHVDVSDLANPPFIHVRCGG